MGHAHIMTVEVVAIPSSFAHLRDISPPVGDIRCPAVKNGFASSARRTPARKIGFRGRKLGLDYLKTDSC
jgi:hypothetical protein